MKMAQTSEMIESLKNDIEIIKGLGQLADSVNQAVTILAKAILELEDPEGNHFLSPGTRNAVRALSETDTKIGGSS
jgi:hypothetical protein